MVLIAIFLNLSFAAAHDLSKDKPVKVNSQAVAPKEQASKVKPSVTKSNIVISSDDSLTSKSSSLEEIFQKTAATFQSLSSELKRKIRKLFRNSEPSNTSANFSVSRFVKGDSNTLDGVDYKRP
jgi:myo-inositol-1-phosphate synthase